MRIFQRTASRTRRIAVTSAMLIVAASAALACDTPVYRYAMYRWFPAPYEVYYFYQGEELDEAGKKMDAAIEEISETDGERANIVFLPVNLDKDKDLTGVPPDVKEAWTKQESPTIPSYLISSPVGVHLHKGELSAEELPALVSSPKRKQIGDLLAAGCAGVYIFLKGEDADTNKESEKVLRGVVDDVGAGKVELYTLPPTSGYGMGPGEEEEGEEAEEEESPYKLNIGMITLSRDETKEKGLLDCLLGLEPDLRDSKEPIVFMIYGRGRALFSCLGKGIYRDNLIEDIYFVTGACSCTVKEQNPGVDLLMQYDWDSAAEKLSREYGAEEGSAYEFGGDQLFPELMIPPEDGNAEEGTAKTETDSVADANDQGDSVAENETADSETDLAQSDSPEPGEQAVGELDGTSDETPGTAVATNLSTNLTTDLNNITFGDESAGSFAGVAWVGAGLLGALVLLFGITFLVMRPH